MHARTSPVFHRFSYPIFFLRLPLLPLSSPSGRLFPWPAINRPGILSFHESDHGPRDGSSLHAWIHNRLAGAGLDAADGEVVLQTFPRIFGYVFNPVSFWLCHDRQGRLRAVLAEVNNTFGEHHGYWIHHPDQRPIRNDDIISVDKRFHVSPFFPVSGEYRFRFRERQGVSAVHIDYFDQGRLQLATRISGRGEPLTPGALLGLLWSYPLMTLRVMTRIHWQALKLFLRGVEFHRKPPPPTEEFSQ